jgi:hypothetical protein
MSDQTAARWSDDDSLSGILYNVISFIQGYVMIVVMTVGVFGNGLSMLVFYRSRRRNDATIYYLGTLAVSDTCCIIFVGLALWLLRGLETVSNGRAYINLYHISSLSCKIMHYLFLVLQSISAWIIAVFSLERAVVVWLPLKRASITPTKRKCFLTVTCASASLICLYTAILSDVLEDADGAKQCFYESSLWLPLLLVENALYYFIPGSLIFTANLFIVLGIAASRRTIVLKMGALPKESQDRKSLINLIIVSTMYLVFMTPSTVTWTYFALALQQSIDPSRTVFLNELGHLFHQWGIFNYCFNFIVYSISLPFFQAELKTLAGIACRRHLKDGKV